MRLPAQTQTIISQTAHEIFGADVDVKIFGSRLDPNAKGGDIDILIQSADLISTARRKSLQLVARLQIRLGDQPIDVLVIDSSTQMQAIHNEVLRTAVSL